MKDLLRSDEKRRLKIAEILYEKNDWMSLTKIAEEVGSSIRSVKYDLEFFKDSLEDFTIETSSHGVRIYFHRNKSLRTLYSNILTHSLSFNLLEEIFLNETYSASELADLLFISPSSLYRMVDHINEVAEKHGIRVETNPCRVIGNEDRIRLFYYQYFYEKYIYLQKSDYKDNELIDNLIQFAIFHTNYQIDFAFYGIVQIISTINYIRFKNKHHTKISRSKINLERLMLDPSTLNASDEYFEKEIGSPINYQLITQLFKPFVEIGYSLNYESLMDKVNSDHRIAKEVNYLEEFLDELAADHNLPIPNKEQMILGIQNARHMEKSDPRMGYILYDRNKSFALDIETKFPNFYNQLCQGLKKYRKLCSLPDTDDGLNYLLYITYSYWESLTLNLRKKYSKIKVLIVSNRHTAHSHMLRDFISYDFSRQLEIDVYLDVFLTTEILEELEYDFIISNFPLPPLKTKNTVLIENIPGAQDHAKIQEEIYRIRENIRLNGDVLL